MVDQILLEINFLVSSNLNGQNVRGPEWKTTRMEDDQNGRRPEWRTTRMEDDQNEHVVVTPWCTTGVAIGGQKLGF